MTNLLGQRIAALRATLKFSQDALAEMAGCSISHLSNIERGQHRNPGRVLLENLALALGVSVDFLVTGNDYDSAIDHALLNRIRKLDDRGRAIVTNLIGHLTTPTQQRLGF